MSAPPGGRQPVHDSDSDDSPRARRGGNSSDSDDDKAAAVGSAEGASAPEEKKDALPEIYVWRIPLKQWREDKSIDRHQSPEFLLDGERWQLLTFPRGNPNHTAHGIFAVYIELKDTRAYFSVPATFKVRFPARAGCFRVSDHCSHLASLAVCPVSDGGDSPFRPVEGRVARCHAHLHAAGQGSRFQRSADSGEFEGIHSRRWMRRAQCDGV